MTALSSVFPGRVSADKIGMFREPHGACEIEPRGDVVPEMLRLQHDLRRCAKAGHQWRLRHSYEPARQSGEQYVN